MAHTSTEEERLDKLEAQLEASQRSMRESIAVEVGAAVKGAVAVMQQTLINRFSTTFEEISKQQGEKLALATSRLESRLNRSRDIQETLISTMRDEQLKFLADIKSTLSNLSYGPSKQPGASQIIDDGGVGVGEGSSSGAGKKVGGFVLNGSGSGIGPGFRGGGLGHGSGFEGNIGNNRNNWRHKKLDMPLFDGTNPDGWILIVERFFSFYGLTEAEKVEATVVALEGSALLWFQWEHRRRPIERWEQVKMLLRRHFRSTSTGTLQEQWLAHCQGGTVSDYCLKFIELLAPLDNVSEELSLGQFLNVLRDNIRAEVRLLSPLTVDHAMDLAHMVEDKL